MMKENLNELTTFMVVAREQSFTRAAAQLRTSQSAISQTVKTLEQRLGLKLLSRTTRSVTPTEAGERLIALVGPALAQIDSGLSQLTALRDKPAGTIRITADEYAIRAVLWPKISAFCTTIRISGSNSAPITAWWTSSPSATTPGCVAAA